MAEQSQQTFEALLNVQYQSIRTQDRKRKQMHGSIFDPIHLLTLFSASSTETLD